ncbi:MAG: Lrp/AsnC family transcriptional regulator [Candidatus Heimdallarchaeota archaeon]|nr:MAG: Lrp/AsnC family transcriptional regulator [Candidatus Heimdallarchaeota archaeon]
MDDKDLKIISALEENSRLSTNDIWRKTGIPQTTVHNRMKKLVKEGIIEGFTIKLNKRMIGKGLGAYILCTVSYRTSKGEKLSQIDVARNVKALPEVEEVSIVTGEIDLIVKVAVKDVEMLNDFVIGKLRDIEGVEKTVTSVVLSEV